MPVPDPPYPTTTRLPDPIGDRFRAGQDGYWQVTNPSTFVSPLAGQPATPLPAVPWQQAGEPLVVPPDQPITG